MTNFLSLSLAIQFSIIINTVSRLKDGNNVVDSPLTNSTIGFNLSSILGDRYADALSKRFESRANQGESQRS